MATRSLKISTVPSMAMWCLVYIVIALHYNALPATAKHLYVFPDTYYTTNCSLEECYTLANITQNSAEYFVSDTTVIFLPGNHIATAITTVPLVNLTNIALLGSEHQESVIRCSGRFGFAFVNVTNLTISKLELSHCGAPMPDEYILTLTNCANLYDLFLKSEKSEVHFFARNSPVIGLVQTYNVTIVNLDVHDSMGPGLLAVNAHEYFSILNSSFISNTPNCKLLYVTAPSLDNTNTLLSIDGSKFMFGNSKESKDRRNGPAAGLGIMFFQVNYHVDVNIANVVLYSNTAVTLSCGNLIFIVERCNQSYLTIQMDVVNCIRGEGFTAGLALLVLVPLVQTVQPSKQYLMYISNSHFIETGLKFKVQMD